MISSELHRSEKKMQQPLTYIHQKEDCNLHSRCYWHGHDCGSHYAHASQSNKSYWGPKIADKATRPGAYSDA